MGGLKNSPGCKCCGTCAVCSDNWNTISNGTDITTGTACGWTKLGGTWAVSSNKLLCTAAGIVTVNAVPPTNMQVKVDVKGTTSGDTIRVLLKFNSTTDYYFVQLTVGSSGTGRLRIYQRVGASENQLATASQSFAAGTTYSLTCCAGSDPSGSLVISAFESVTGTNVVYNPASTSPGSATGVGLAVGALTTSVTFDNFTLSKVFENGATCAFCGCYIESDSFDRADNSDINASSPFGWTVDNGAFAISSNKLTTSSTMAAAKFGVARPNFDMSISAAFTLAAIGDCLRILMNYVDKDNYWCAELNQGGVPATSADTNRGWTSIISRAAGAETVIARLEMNTGASTSTFTLCFDSTTNRMTAGQSSSLNWVTGIMPTAPTSLAVGLGTGATLSAGMTFNDFSVQQTSPACAPCATCGCPSGTGTPPNMVKLVISGFSNLGGAGKCTGCFGLNGTFLLTLLGKGSPTPGAGLCAWGYTLPSAICGVRFIYAVANTGASEWAVELATDENNYPNLAPLNFTSGTITNVGCDSETSLSLTNFNAGSTLCSGAGAACALTTIA